MMVGVTEPEKKQRLALLVVSVMLQLQAAAGTMSSVQAFREFINQRLTAAAAEIFTEFERTIVRYQEQMDRQSTWTPHIRLTAAELQLSSCEEVQLLNQETSCGPEEESEEPPQIKEDQEEPEALQVKEEQEEVSISQEEEQMMLKLEAETFVVTSGHLSEVDGELLVSGDAVGAERRGHIERQPAGSRPIRDVELLEVSPVSESQQVRLCAETCVGEQGDLLGHLSMSGGQKRFTCQVCGKSCSRQDNLSVHMRTHTDEKPYSCDACGKGFKYRHNFLIHLRNHTGEKPYTCSSCGRSYTSSSSLIKHTMIHTGEKPYMCDTCGKSFRRQDSLLVHKRTHTGEKPYTCDTCGSGFSKRCNLVVHMRTHTGEKLHACQTCGKSFSRQSSLLVHMRNH